MKVTVFFGFCALLILGRCSTTPVKPEVKKTEPGVGALSPEQEKAKSGFLDAVVKKGEVFRIFITSDEYTVRQTSAEKTISLKADAGSDTDVREEIAKNYDKIDYSVTAIISVELYPDSGKLSRIRFQKPTGLSEMDKLVSEDVSRLIFEFKEDNIEPSQFTVTYMIMLRKKISRDQAKELLQKYVKP